MSFKLCSYDKSEQADKSGVIPVFLALSKLLLDMALIKLCNYFTKIEKVNFNFIGVGWEKTRNYIKLASCKNFQVT